MPAATPTTETAVYMEYKTPSGEESFSDIEGLSDLYTWQPCSDVLYIKPSSPVCLQFDELTSYRHPGDQIRTGGIRIYDYGIGVGNITQIFPMKTGF